MADELKPLIQTLAIIERDGQILLGLKARKMGAGRRSNPGGNLEEKDVSIEASAKREVWEEIKVVVEEMEKVGVIDFAMPHKGIDIQMHIFKVTRFSGEPQETTELRDLRWYPRDQQPLKEMWPDDEFWLPYYLEGKQFTGKFLLGEQEAVLNHEITVIEKGEGKFH